MRGASALETLLRGLPRAEVCVLVVWEPILWSDLAPPRTNELARIRDGRAVQLWDPGLLLSSELVRTARANPSQVPPDGQGVVERVGPAWDLVALYPPGARWETALPAPALLVSPVVDGIDAIREHLRR